jgi:hypothetical protein
MGEAPLNTLTEPHEFRGSAQRLLARTNTRLQEQGWWFNTEYATLEPSPTNGNIQLPGDCIKWLSGVRAPDTLVLGTPQPWLVQRGSRLYDTRNRTFVITEDAVGSLVREIAFEDLPPVMNDYVAAVTVLRFQSNFDADNNKRQELELHVRECRTALQAEHIRQSKTNLLDNNVRLTRVKAATRRLRY